MAINLELKIALFSYSEIIQEIEKNHMQFIDTFWQKDTYYKISDGLLKLRIQNDTHQLIKYKRDETNVKRWSNYSILSLDGLNIEEYLSDLFEIEAIVEKERTLFMYKNTRIHLDDVKNLGKFIELETVVENITQKQAIYEFSEVIKMLNLNREEEIRGSYRDLILKK